MPWAAILINLLLCYMRPEFPQTLTGTVVRFKGNGRKLGYPTANLKTATDLADGVYFGYADLAGFIRHPALIFIGTPTTLGDTERRLEVYLLDIPDQDYYDQELLVNIHYYHRPNETFPGIEELLVVMRNDETEAWGWFNSQSDAVEQS